MSTIIAGHTLTAAERRTLDEILDYLRKNAGDSFGDLLGDAPIPQRRTLVVG